MLFQHRSKAWDSQPRHSKNKTNQWFSSNMACLNARSRNWKVWIAKNQVEIMMMRDPVLGMLFFSVVCVAPWCLDFSNLIPPLHLKRGHYWSVAFEEGVSVKHRSINYHSIEQGKGARPHNIKVPKQAKWLNSRKCEAAHLLANYIRIYKIIYDFLFELLQWLWPSGDIVLLAKHSKYKGVTSCSALEKKQAQTI